MARDLDFSIRDARADEAEAVRELTLAAYREYAEMMPIQFWEAYRNNIEHSLDNRGAAQTIVAEHAETIVGSVLLYPPANNAYGGAAGSDVGTDEAIPEMRLLSVTPSMRGRGIGAALTYECIRRAESNGASALGLHTTDMMQTAMQMYERMGFERAPETDFYPSKTTVIKGFRLPLQTRS